MEDAASLWPSRRHRARIPSPARIKCSQIIRFKCVVTGKMMASHCGGYQTLLSGSAAKGMPLINRLFHKGQYPARTDCWKNNALGQWVIAASENVDWRGKGKAFAPNPTPRSNPPVNTISSAANAISGRLLRAIQLRDCIDVNTVQ